MTIYTKKGSFIINGVKKIIYHKKGSQKKYVVYKKRHISLAKYQKIKEPKRIVNNIKPKNNYRHKGGVGNIELILITGSNQRELLENIKRYNFFVVYSSTTNVVKAFYITDDIMKSLNDYHDKNQPSLILKLVDLYDLDKELSQNIMRYMTHYYLAIIPESELPASETTRKFPKSKSTTSKSTTSKSTTSKSTISNFPAINFPAINFPANIFRASKKPTSKKPEDIGHKI